MTAVMLYTGGGIGIGVFVGWIAVAVALVALWKAQPYTRRLFAASLLASMLSGGSGIVVWATEVEPGIVIASDCKYLTPLDWEWWAKGCIGLP